MKYRILIVEDDEINYLYLESLLELFVKDVEIIHSTNGKEAIEIVNSKEVNLVFMDLKMPIMDGYEATKIIKETKPELVIIAQTAFTGDTERQKALEAGCNDFLSKPIKKSTIHNYLNTYLFKI